MRWRRPNEEATYEYCIGAHARRSTECRRAADPIREDCASWRGVDRDAVAVAVAAARGTGRRRRRRRVGCRRPWVEVGGWPAGLTGLFFSGAGLTGQAGEVPLRARHSRKKKSSVAGRARRCRNLDLT
jgi:hypothetical protein